LEFFAFLEETRAPGEGFALYGPTHIAFLLGILIGIIIIVFTYKKTGGAAKRKYIKKLAIAIFFMEFSRQIIIMLLLPVYPVGQIPLHLCGMTIFIEIFHAFFPNKTTGEILYSLGLPGTLAALLFPNWTMYPINNFFPINSFVIHGLHAAFIISLLASGEIKPAVKNLWRPLLFLAAALPFAYFINQKLGTNFYFINAGSEGSPLEILIDLMGVPWFLFGYAGLLFFVWIVLYAPIVLRERFAKPEKES
jgi:hypothetical integral membrane protein (TIGR02206 family)